MNGIRFSGVSRRGALLALACLLLLAFVHSVDPHHLDADSADRAPCLLCGALPGLLLTVWLVVGHAVRPSAPTFRHPVFPSPFSRESWRLLPRRGPPAFLLS